MHNRHNRDNPDFPILKERLYHSSHCHCNQILTVLDHPREEISMWIEDLHLN